MQQGFGPIKENGPVHLRAPGHRRFPPVGPVANQSAFFAFFRFASAAASFAFDCDSVFFLSALACATFASLSASSCFFAAFFSACVGSAVVCVCATDTVAAVANAPASNAANKRFVVVVMNSSLPAAPLQGPRSIHPAENLLVLQARILGTVRLGALELVVGGLVVGLLVDLCVAHLLLVLRLRFLVGRLQVLLRCLLRRLVFSTSLRVGIALHDERVGRRRCDDILRRRCGLRGRRSWRGHLAGVGGGRLRGLRERGCGQTHGDKSGTQQHFLDLRHSDFLAGSFYSGWWIATIATHRDA